MRVVLLCLAVLVAALIAAPTSSAITAKWCPCGKDGSAAAARAAGLPQAIDNDPKLQQIFSGEKPTSILQLYKSYCADFDRDGDVDRAVDYACCTVSSPSPYAILRHDPTGWTTVYARLSDTVFRFVRRGGRMIVKSPKYGPNDPNCCPSRISTRELRFSHAKWVGHVTVGRP